MKIGILTFHWATNYGAALQAYALQTYLRNLGHDVYIINYRPKQYKKTIFKCFFRKRFWLCLAEVKEYIKEKKVEEFRKKYLNETSLYGSLDELRKNPPEFEVYICGSDQIWNPSFTAKGEGKPTSAYFLDFGDTNITRIAYAVSFGCEEYPEAAAIIAKKYMRNFKAISVREDSGISIVTRMGFKNPVKMPDPTLLLSRDDYLFNDKENILIKQNAFVYILRNEYSEVKGIISNLQSRYEILLSSHLLNSDSIQEWVNKIRNASIVLTNSFHGMVFSLIFHIPFIVVPAKGSEAGMNDRFYSLLSDLNLQHRIMADYDIEKLNVILEERISWDRIDIHLANLKSSTSNFFLEYLKA
jgi:hypothetical protein